MQTGLFWRHLAQWCLGASGLSQLRLIGPSVKFIPLNKLSYIKGFQANQKAL